MRTLCLFATATLCALPLSIPLARGEAKHQLKHDIPDTLKCDGAHAEGKIVPVCNSSALSLLKFEIFDAFDSVVAIFDQDLDGDLDCLSAARVAYDPEKQEATYIWILKGLNGKQPENITFHMKPGATSDTTVFTMGNDTSHQQTATFVYTNYKDCLVGLVTYKGTERGAVFTVTSFTVCKRLLDKNENFECILWVTEALKDDVPQGCVDYFDDNCDSKKESYVKDACSSS